MKKFTDYSAEELNALKISLCFTGALIVLVLATIQLIDNRDTIMYMIAKLQECPSW